MVKSYFYIIVACALDEGLWHGWLYVESFPGACVHYVP